MASLGDKLGYHTHPEIQLEHVTLCVGGSKRIFVLQ